MKLSAYKAFVTLSCALSLVGCVHKPKNVEIIDREITPSKSGHKTKLPSDLVVDPNKFVSEIAEPVLLGGGLMRWSKFSVESEVVALPVVGKDTFFVLSKERCVKAYKIKNRELVWSTSIDAPSLSNSSMILHGDKLYVAAGDCLSAFSASEGKQVFYKQLQAPISSGLCLHNGTCYLQTTQGLHAINTTTGATITEALPCDANSLSQISPVIYKNKIVFTSCAGHVAILDSDVAKSFPRLIRFASGANPPPTVSGLVSQPVVDKKYCYFATSHGALQKCDLDKETVVWSLEVPVIQSISLINDTIFAATRAGQVMAIRAKSGRVLWISSLKVNGSDEFLTPFIPNMAWHLALTTYSTLHNAAALLLGGTTQFSSMPVAEKPVVVIAKSGKVFTLHPSTGGILRTMNLPCEDKIISAAISGSRLMLFGEKGSILKNR